MFTIVPSSSRTFKSLVHASNIEICRSWVNAVYEHDLCSEHELVLFKLNERFGN